MEATSLETTARLPFRGKMGGQPEEGRWNWNLRPLSELKTVWTQAM